jgi:hypothetical protein
MRIEQHPVAINAVRGVGSGIWEYILFPLPTLIDAYNQTGNGETPSTPGTPRPTFASSFGGALGETTGKALIVAAIIGGALWYLSRKRP